MEIETHKIKKLNNQIKVFRRFNNQNEIFTLIISSIKILALCFFVIFGCIVLFQKNEFSLFRIILPIIIVFLIWILYSQIKDFFIFIKKNIKPILVIEKSEISTLNQQGKNIKTEIKNIRSVQGKIYSEITGTENLRIIYYCEISLLLKNGKDLSVDVINSAKIFSPLENDVMKELRKKSKKIGSFLANELDVQFFLKNKIKNQY